MVSHVSPVEPFGVGHEHVSLMQHQRNSNRPNREFSRRCRVCPLAGNIPTGHYGVTLVTELQLRSDLSRDNINVNTVPSQQTVDNNSSRVNTYLKNASDSLHVDCSCSYCHVCQTVPWFITHFARIDEQHLVPDFGMCGRCANRRCDHLRTGSLYWVSNEAGGPPGIPRPPADSLYPMPDWEVFAMFLCHHCCPITRPQRIGNLPPSQRHGGHMIIPADPVAYRVVPQLELNETSGCSTGCNINPMASCRVTYMHGSNTPERLIQQHDPTRTPRQQCHVLVTNRVANCPGRSLQKYRRTAHGNQPVLASQCTLRVL